ncbi:MAG: UDP-3-O-(3-hydroxymyristoyl)glucosamine N-acyltransferase [Thermoguttaceae bacterium]
MEKQLSELAVLVEGTLICDVPVIVRGASPIHNSGPNDITFLDNIEKSHLLAKTKACAAVFPRIPDEFDTAKLPKIPLIVVDDVLDSFEKIAKLFVPPKSEQPRTVDPKAAICQSARIGANVMIGPFAVIGENVEIGDGCTIHAGVQILENCKIGADTTVYPNAVLYENCIVGSHCIIHSCSVIGAYGFGYDSSKGFHRLSSQLGNVVIEDKVEIGACSTIDRGTYGSTQIGEGTKIDNLVMIAHNCKIGKFNLICAHTGIAGSTTTGDYVVMAGRVGVRDHVHIGQRAVLGAMAGVMTDIPDDARWVGIPATPEKEQMKKQVALAKLPELRKEVKAMQQKIDELNKALANK